MNEGNLAETIRRAQTGDLDAFAALYNRTAKQAYYLSYKLVQNEEDAKDVVQESMLELFESIGTVKHPAAFKSFLNRVLYHNSMDLLRKRQKDYIVTDSEETMLTIESDDMKPEDYLVQQERQAEMRHLIDALSPEQKIVTLMFYYEHMSVREIAQSLEIQESAVKNRLTRARTTLRQMLKEDERTKSRMFGGLFFFPFGLRKLLQQEANDVFSDRIGKEIWSQLEPALHQANLINSGAAAGAAAVKTAISKGTKTLIAAATISAGVLGAASLAERMPVPDTNPVDTQPPVIEEVLEPPVEPEPQSDAINIVAPPIENQPQQAEQPLEETDTAEMTVEPIEAPVQPVELPEEEAPPQEEQDTGTGSAVIPEIQIQTRALEYPGFCELSAAQILADCGATLSQSIDAPIIVTGHEEISTEEPGQYAVFLTVEGREDISSKVITISIYFAEEETT